MAASENGCAEQDRSMAASEVPDNARTTHINGEKDADGSDDEEEEGDDSEPRLKYTRLTDRLAAAYRNGDSASATLVSGGYILTGTHNGTLHAHVAPSFQLRRSFKAHSASITAIAASPHSSRPFVLTGQSSDASSAAANTNAGSARGSLRSWRPTTATTLAPFYVATASLDGKVCIASLSNPEDVIIRNYARPVLAVAISPTYKHDRSFLSGGLAGSLMLTVGGRPGTQSNASIGSAASTASGWLGSLGLASTSGKDTVLHSGEGAITAISWSPSGRFVVWVNEKGIKIMRSGSHLDIGQASEAWRRIGHIDHPNNSSWEAMSGVWKPRLHWIDHSQLEKNDDSVASELSSPPHDTAQPKATKRSSMAERLLVGWGDTIWTIDIGASGSAIQRRTTEQHIGRPTVLHQITIDDGIISDVSFWNQNLLIALVYRSRTDDDEPSASSNGASRRGLRRRRNALPIDIRFIETGEPSQIVDIESLEVSRYESLSAADYVMSTLYVPQEPSQDEPRGAFDSIGNSLLDAGRNATRLFSSNASMISGSSGGETSDASVSIRGAEPKPKASVPQMLRPGLKLFVSSPYDCLMAVRPDMSDRLDWLVQKLDFRQAWHLLDRDPSVVPNKLHDSEDKEFKDSPPHSPAPSKDNHSLADFLADDSSSLHPDSNLTASKVEKEKRHIGQLWVKQLVDNERWAEAGQVAGLVTDTTALWDNWLRIFIAAGQFDDIVDNIPSSRLRPPLSKSLYSKFLSHYIHTDVSKARSLLSVWDNDCLDADAVIESCKERLDDPYLAAGNETWTALQDIMAILYMVALDTAQALRCYIATKNTAAATSLVAQYELYDVISEDIWTFLQLPNAADDEVEVEADDAEEILEIGHVSPIKLLAYGAQHNQISLEIIVNNLLSHQLGGRRLLFDLFKILWKGETPSINPERQSSQASPSPTDTRRSRISHLRSQRVAKRFGGQQNAGTATRAATRMMLVPYTRLVVDTFAQFSRELLHEVLRSSEDSVRLPYDYSHALDVCEKYGYTDDVIYILSATGRTREALQLIIDKIGDVSQAINFAKDVDEPSLWNDLVQHSMKNPRFIVALLSQGLSPNANIAPADLVRRIPDGLEINGLKAALLKLLRENELQTSIAQGAVQVFQSEVATTMTTLRIGRERGIAVDIKQAHSKVQDNFEALSHSVGERAYHGHCLICEKALRSEDSVAGIDRNLDDYLMILRCGHVVHLPCLLERADATQKSRIVSELEAQLRKTSVAGMHRHIGVPAQQRVSKKIGLAMMVSSAMSSSCPFCTAVTTDD